MRKDGGGELPPSIDGPPPLIDTDAIRLQIDGGVQQQQRQEQEILEGSNQQPQQTLLSPNPYTSGATAIDMAISPSEEKSIAQIMRRISIMHGTTEELDEAVKESREVILRIQGKTGYLPPTYADKLLFLAHAPNNPTWVPFEEGQAHVFALSTRADHRTSFWLSPLIAIPLMLLFSCAAWIGVATWTDGLESKDILVIMSFVGMMGSFLSNLFGWWVTGVNPDQSSIAANARQNAVLELSDLYDELAYELIDLWKVDRRSCQVLCARLDIEWIKAASIKAGANHGEIVAIFRLFESAMKFIVHDILPRQHHLVHYISVRSDSTDEVETRCHRSGSIGPQLHSVVDQWITSAASLRPLKLISATPTATTTNDGSSPPPSSSSPKACVSFSYGGGSHHRQRSAVTGKKDDMAVMAPAPIS